MRGCRYADQPADGESTDSYSPLSEQASTLVESLRKHSVWVKVDALRRTAGVNDRYDELPTPMDRQDLADYAEATEECYRELVAEIDKLRMLASELEEVAKQAKWAAEKPAGRG